MRVTLETKNATRKRILEVAEKHFAQRGFDTTTTRDIAKAAKLAVGTLFNYFPTKESVAECLVVEACAEATEAFNAESSRTEQCSVLLANASLSLEEDLFAYVAAILRKLKPHRKYVSAVLETSLSPLASEAANAQGATLRSAHLEMVSEIAARHGQQDALSAVALQLYWTLLTGVLAFWSRDASPRQEDTLALLDQSLSMFVLWLSSQTEAHSETESRIQRKEG